MYRLFTLALFRYDAVWYKQKGSLLFRPFPGSVKERTKLIDVNLGFVGNVNLLSHTECYPDKKTAEKREKK